MLRHTKENTHSDNIEFISYTGKWPNLCGGVLTLNIDGEVVKFGHDYLDPNYRTDNHFNSFWSSGGSCGFTHNYEDSYVATGEWNIDVEDIPDQYKKYAEDLDRVFNENVDYGCCGGCL